MNCTVLRVVAKQLFLYFNKRFVADTGYMCVRRNLVARFKKVDQLLKTVAIYNTQRAHIHNYKLSAITAITTACWGEVGGHFQTNLLYSAQAISTLLVLFGCFNYRLLNRLVVLSPSVSCCPHYLQGTLTSLTSSKTTSGSSKQYSHTCKVQTIITHVQTAERKSGYYI